MTHKEVSILLTVMESGKVKVLLAGLAFGVGLNSAEYSALVGQDIWEDCDRGSFLYFTLLSNCTWDSITPEASPHLSMRKLGNQRALIVLLNSEIPLTV